MTMQTIGPLTHIVQGDQRLSPAAIIVADGEEETVADQRRDELLEVEGEQATADDGQVEVVDFEQPVELQRRALFHNLPTTEDDDVVRGQGHGRLEHRRHGRAARDEAELLGLVSHDLFKGMGEDGPQLDTERPVEGGHTVLEP